MSAWRPTQCGVYWANLAERRSHRGYDFHFRRLERVHLIGLPRALRDGPRRIFFPAGEPRESALSNAGSRDRAARDLVVGIIAERSIPAIVHAGDLSQLDLIWNDGRFGDRVAAETAGYAAAVPGTRISISTTCLRICRTCAALFDVTGISPGIRHRVRHHCPGTSVLFLLERAKSKHGFNSPGDLTGGIVCKCKKGLKSTILFQIQNKPLENAAMYG